MKYFILTLMLIFSAPSLAGFGDPSSSAYRFTVTSSANDEYDAFVDFLAFDGFNTVNLRYRVAGSSDKWVYLAAPEIDESDLSTPDLVNAEVDRLIQILNDALFTEFGQPDSGQPSQPLAGLERLRWILQYALSEKNNVITRS